MGLENHQLHYSNEDHLFPFEHGEFPWPCYCSSPESRLSEVLKFNELAFAGHDGHEIRTCEMCLEAFLQGRVLPCSSHHKCRIFLYG